jgi:hypothetical protein
MKERKSDSPVVIKEVKTITPIVIKEIKTITPIVIKKTKSDYSYCNEGDQNAITSL